MNVEDSNLVISPSGASRELESRVPCAGKGSRAERRREETSDRDERSGSPLVSVVIPACNAARHLGETVRSIAAQTYTNVEIVVVDDGSDDGTAGVVRALQRVDRRIVLIQQENAGVAAARNRGIQHSRGDYVAPVDADDVWCPVALEKLVLRLEDAGDAAGVAYAWSAYIDRDGLPDGGYRVSAIEGHVHATLACHNFLGNASCTLIRRACFDAVGLYDSSYRSRGAEGCEDWDLYLRIAERYEFRVVPEFLIGYRKDSQSMSCKDDAMGRSHALLLDSLRRRHERFSPALLRLSTGSFYIYLAGESSRRGNRRRALHWLGRALRADPVTPFLRWTFYALLATNTLRLLSTATPRRRQRHRPRRVSREFHASLHVSAGGGGRTGVRLRIVLQNVLHALVSKTAKDRIARRGAGRRRR